MVEANEIEKMLVVSTRKSWAIFSDSAGEKGFVCYWEDIDEVYSSTQKEIYVIAYYAKK